MGMPGNGPLHGAEGHLVGRFVLDVEVAERRLADRRFDPRDLVLRVDGRVHPIPSEHRDGDDVHLLGLDDVAIATLLELFPAPEGDGVGARQAGSFEKPVRVQPQIELIEVRQFLRHGHWYAVAVDVPRGAAVDDVRLTRRPLGGRAALPAEPVLPRRRVQSRLAIECFLAGAGFPIDGAGVVVQRVDARPVDVDGVFERLADRARVAGAGVGDALEVGFADLLRRGSQQGSRVDIAGRESLSRGLDSQRSEQSHGGRCFHGHVLPSRSRAIIAREDVDS